MARKPRKKRIIILGGGFGGVYAAMRLEKLLGRRASVEIRLVSRDNFFLFTPMLHEIAASDLEITNIVNPLRKLLRKVDVVVGNVHDIDLPGRRVVISRGSGGHLHEIGYDHLVIALGSVINSYNLPGFADFAMPMKSLRDAIQLRAQVLRHLEEANSECNSDERRALLTFVIAGGGFAGVETVAALNDFVREALPFYPNLREKMLRVLLIHSGPMILPELGEDLGRYSREALEQRGVEILLNDRVKSITQQGVALITGLSISTRNLVWTAGTLPSPLVSSLPCEKTRGRVPRKSIPPGPGLAGRLGSWRLCVHSGNQKSDQIPSTNSPTCNTRRQNSCSKYRGRTFRATAKIIFIQHRRTTGIDRAPHRRGADLGFQFLRLPRLVDVADDLPQ